MQANKHNPEDISRRYIKKESTKEVEEESNHQNHNEEHTPQQQVTDSRRPQPKHPLCTRKRETPIKK
jgi:hypothetical protein